VTKYLILGHGGHGKGSVASIMQGMGITCISSSVAALHTVIFPQMRDRYKTPVECYHDRRNRRREWLNLITDYNTPDAGRLCREMLSQYDCYDGMRPLREYEATSHLFDVILYVDASDRCPSDQTMEIPFDASSMMLIDNNGSESDLIKRITKCRLIKDCLSSQRHDKLSISTL